MNPLKKLMGETVIYGFSTILGRFINWLLVPLYTRVLSPVDNGISTNLMGYVALLVVLLTYGTETGFFRFATKENKDKVFSTLLSSLLFTSTIFLILSFSFLPQIVNFLEIGNHPIYFVLLIVTIFIDVISTLPFALLRMEGKALRFGVIKFVNILINVGLNLFFYLLCPFLEKRGISVPFYQVDGGVVYIFFYYLISYTFSFLMLLPYIFRFKFIL